jgi:hypothetical protein
MIIKKVAALTAASLLVASTGATAQSASALSLSKSPAVAAKARASTKAEGNKFESIGFGAILLGAGALALLIWGIIEITDDDDPDSP